MVREIAMATSECSDPHLSDESRAIFPLQYSFSIFMSEEIIIQFYNTIRSSCIQINFNTRAQFVNILCTYTVSF